MSIPDFQFDPPTGHNNTDVFPTYPAQDQVRPLFQRLFDQIRDFINNSVKGTVNTHLAETVSEQIIVTRDAAITGVQFVSGLRGKPKTITIIANNFSSNGFSIGIWSENGGNFVTHRSAEENRFYGTSRIVAIGSNTINMSRATLQNVLNGSFELAWEHVGSGAIGDIQMFVLCQYHGGA